MQLSRVITFVTALPAISTAQFANKPDFHRYSRVYPTSIQVSISSHQPELTLTFRRRSRMPRLVYQ